MMIIVLLLINTVKNFIHSIEILNISNTNVTEIVNGCQLDKRMIQLHFEMNFLLQKVLSLAITKISLFSWEKDKKKKKNVDAEKKVGLKSSVFFSPFHSGLSCFTV